MFTECSLSILAICTAEGYSREGLLVPRQLDVPRVCQNASPGARKQPSPGARAEPSQATVPKQSYTTFVHLMRGQVGMDSTFLKVDATFPKVDSTPKPLNP
jgi:hypothetical protein